MAINKPISNLYQQWLKRRIPPDHQVTLGQRSIFIFPSRFGALYLLMCSFLFILGTNYQNNIILLLAFGLIGLFISSIFFSYANLSGLTLKSTTCQPVYADETALIPIYLADSLDRNLLTFAFAKQRPVTLDIAKNQDKVLVPFKPLRRGRHNPQRLTLRSYFPLGLLRCWSHVDLAIEIIIYPATIEAYVPLMELPDDQQTERPSVSEMEDFAGIRDHIQGESLSRISWKHVARHGQGRLVSKQFSGQEYEAMWLILNQLQDSNIEIKLSKLAHAVDYYSRQNVLFGLDLNKTKIPPNTGEAHRLACLEALALW